MAKFDNEVVNAFTPRMGNAVSRWLGQTTMDLMGWTIKGQFPLEKKLIFIGAPHTSNWDFIIAISSMQAVGIRASWMMKKEAFFWPLGGLFKAIGGVPIDRKAKNDLTAQMADWFNDNEIAWLGITPEGTRSKVPAFKKGYLRIAKAAKVPVFIVGIHAKTKQVVLDKIWELTGDIDKDNAAIRDYYAKTFVGFNPENA